MTDPFQTRAHVADFDAISAGYSRASDAVRASVRYSSDIAYGPHPDERLDLFFPVVSGPAPVHLFVHGGYWRANRKEDYAFMAAPVVDAGGIAAIVEYSLMPKVRLFTIVDQVRRAARWLHAQAPAFGGDPARLSASGHSAGAHLASYLAAAAACETDGPAVPVRSLLLLSGIYDLRPIATSFLQPEILLSEAEVRCWSPLDAAPNTGVRIAVAVGKRETAPFLEQAAAYAKRNSASLHVLDDLDHMTIVREAGTPGSARGRLLARTLEQRPQP